MDNSNQVLIILHYFQELLKSAKISLTFQGHARSKVMAQNESPHTCFIITMKSRSGYTPSAVVLVLDNL